MSAPLAAAPWVPADDGMVLERLPAGMPSAVAAVAPAAPRDPQSAAAIARAYIERSRQDGDPRFLGYAEGVLQPWWSQALPPAPVLVLRATLLQSRHRFDEALRDLDALLATHPDDAQALLTRATILRVRGRHDEALRDCAALGGRASDFVAQLCFASVRGVSGGLAEAADTLDALAPRGAAQSPGVRTWFLAERADIAERLGRDRQALAIYREALALEGSDPLLRAAAADLLLRLHQPAMALAIAGDDPRADVVRLRTALAARALGRPRADLEAALASAYAAAHARGDDIHLREEARFVLEIPADPRRALALAQRNWASQREPADALLLATAARAAGDDAVLDGLRRWQRDTGLQDARLAP